MQETIQNILFLYDKLISGPKGITKGLAEYLYASDLSEKLIALAAKDVVVDYRHNKVGDRASTVLNVATKMNENISKLHATTPLHFPDELLNEWQKRVKST